MLRRTDEEFGIGEGDFVCSSFSYDGLVERLLQYCSYDTLYFFHFLTGYIESFGFENTFKSLSPTAADKPIWIDLFNLLIIFQLWETKCFLYNNFF